jgi:hypothetical protein
MGMLLSSENVSPTFQPKRSAVSLPTITPRRSAMNAARSSGVRMYSGYMSMYSGTSTAKFAKNFRKSGCPPPRKPPNQFEVATEDTPFMCAILSL